LPGRLKYLQQNAWFGAGRKNSADYGQALHEGEDIRKHIRAGLDHAQSDPRFLSKRFHTGYDIVQYLLRRRAVYCRDQNEQVALEMNDSESP